MINNIAHWATNLIPRVCATLVLSGNEIDWVTKPHLPKIKIYLPHAISRDANLWRPSPQ